MLGKLGEKETVGMEGGRGRAMGRKRAEKSRERVEERWGEVRGKRSGERGRRAERWGEKEDERGTEAGRVRELRRQGEMEVEAGKWPRRNWATQELELTGFPEVRGTRIPMWSQPSSSSFFYPWGFKEEEEAAAGRRSWGGWPSQGSSPHPPETSPTRLPRVQQEVETLCSFTVGNPSMHREAGTEQRLCACVLGGGEGPSSMSPVVTLTRSVAFFFF